MATTQNNRFLRNLPLPQVFKACRIVMHGAALFAALATILGFAGALGWGFELLDHPRPQYCLLLTIAIIFGAFSRRAWSFLWCVPLALNLVTIVPLFLSPVNSSAPLPSLAPCRLVHINLDRENEDPARAIAYIESQNADLIFLQEVTSQWLTQLRTNLSRYKVVASVPLENSQGVAMLLPVERSPTLELTGMRSINLPEDSERPMLEATAQWGDQKVAILSLHITRSQDRGSWAFQQTEFDAAAQWSQTQQQKGHQVIAIGDLNITPWSSRFQRFLHNSGLRNSQRGFGLQPTWRAGWPSPLTIPIDHCLHGNSIKTLTRTPGPNIGSDHRPLLVELARTA